MASNSSTLYVFEFKPFSLCDLKGERPMERPEVQGQDCDETKMCSIKGFVKAGGPVSIDRTCGGSRGRWP